jgi:TRAP-type uncharacterized transport system substrate-binding protein
MVIFRSLAFVGILLVCLCTQSFAEQDSVEVTAMTTPFGTAGYTLTMAFEETFKNADSWVKWKTKETPGAMYMFKYTALNHNKLVRGELPQVVIPIQGGLLRYIIEGRPPFQEIPNPDLRALFSLQAAIFLMVTFDNEIKDVKDLAGKKIGVSEKARVFQNDLLNRPYFEKGLGIWDKIQWHYLGSINAKDALLNNRIDAKSSLFLGNMAPASDGTYVCTKLVPEGCTLELLNSGRKLVLLSWDPEIIKKSYDINKDMSLFPILIKKGAYKGIDRDIWGIGNIAKVIGSASMPDSMVEEMIRVRHRYREKLGKYHPMLELLPESPYPIGTAREYVHPGVEKAMKKLGLPIPQKN